MARSRRKPRPQPPPEPTPDPAADAAWQAMLAEQEMARVAASAVFFVDPAQLHAELAALGYAESALAARFDGVVLTGRAIAVLVAHLPRPYAPRVWENIVGSLARREARPAFAALATAYRFERVPERRGLLAQAIAAMATFHEASGLPGIEAYETLFGPSYAPPPMRSGR